MRIPVAKEVMPYFIPSILLTVIFFAFNLWFGIIGLIISIYFLYFFRDPERTLPDLKNAIVSPADGVIVGVDHVMENEFFKDKVCRISIFLSIFNVHMNYSPINGKVVYFNYQKGQFLPANSPKSAIVNESNSIGISDNNGFKLIVRQIAGIIARRVVCGVKEGDFIEKGQKFGMIKFSSRVEVYLPVTAKVKVKKGDIVKGKISILGEINK